MKLTKEEILARPERYRVLDGGAVYDMEQKHIVTHMHNGEGKYQITPDKGRQMRERQKEMAQQRAAEAIDEAAIEEGKIPKTAAPGEGWKGVVKKVTKTLFTSENLRGQAEAARFLGQAAGYYNTPEEEESSFAQVRGIIHDLAELGRQINQAQERQQTNNVIDA